MKYSIPYIIYVFNEMLSGRNTLEIFQGIKKTQQYSQERLKEFQFERLKALLVHAYDHVEYYRDSFEKSGFNPKAINRFEELSKIPLLSKGDIRKDLGKFISKDGKIKLARYATSGSTGEPLIFFLSKKRIASNKAAYLMLYDWWGLTIGSKEVVLWGSSRDISAYHLIKRLRDRLLNTRLLPVFCMSEDTIYRYINFIRRYRPEDIFGYAHSIYLLARFIRNRGFSLQDIGIKVVFTTAETLQDYQRKLIEEVFGCSVCNCYGGRESGLVAFECQSKTMHLNPCIITEFVNGEIVVTDLDSYGMPFIRYRTGDQAIPGEDKNCPCGNSFPSIGKIIGRNTDYLVNTKGEFIHPLALEYIFRELEHLDYFKITQKKEDELLVELSTTDKLSKVAEPEIAVRIQQIMNADCRVVFRYIGRAEIKEEDKYKFVVSEVIKQHIGGK